MSQIEYDPIKDRFAAFIRRSRFFRRVFYALLDMFFIRSWVVRRRLRKEFAGRTGLRVLDAGCGFGQYDRFLLATFPDIRVDAIDVKEEYLDDCRRYFAADIAAGRISFRQSDLTADTYPPDYDAVICVDVLEHIGPDVAVMATLRGALKPGGFLLMHSPSDRAEEDADGDGFFVGEHARPGYGAADLDAKLREAGFDRTDIRLGTGPLAHAAWILLIKWPMLWMNRHFAFVAVLPFWYALTLLPGLALMRLDVRKPAEAGYAIMGLGYRDR